MKFLEPLITEKAINRFDLEAQKPVFEEDDKMVISNALIEVDIYKKKPEKTLIRKNISGYLFLGALMFFSV